MSYLFGMSQLELEEMAKILEASGTYRVIRKLGQRSVINPPDQTPLKTGLFVDVETTGLDSSKDEIIELAMVPFTYSDDGRIFEIKGAFQQLQQPKKPVPPEITTLTGITDEMVRGQNIDRAEVEALVGEADLIIAHNAGFDRRFLERFSQSFAIKPWACSMSQIDWRAEGYEGAKLSYLANEAGFFYDRHRAVNDCLAAIELLALRLPRSQSLTLYQLLERANRPTWRIWAENAPFDFKDILKARGYRWADGTAGPKAWYTDIADEKLNDELKYLRSEIYQREINLNKKKITALERFSVRA